MGINKKNLLILLRHDQALKPGGDTNLLRNFGKLAADRFNLIITDDVKCSLQGIDLVFAANIDRPIEPNYMLKRCSKEDIPFLLYTLHHPYPGIKKYLRHGTHGLRKFLAVVSLCHPIVYEQFLWILRVFKLALFDKIILPIGSVKNAQKNLLNNSSCIITCCEAELQQIEHDIGPVMTRQAILPHQLDILDNNESVESAGNTTFLLCPGRIETRKNQMMILEMAREFPDYHFFFVGDISPSESRYGQKFMDNMKLCPNVSYKKAISKNEFYKIVRNAQVLINASWFECTSLIDLYGGAIQKKLITTMYSYAHHFFPDIYTFDPSNKNQMKKAITQALSSPLLPHKKQKAKISIFCTDNIKEKLLVLLEGF